MRLLSSKFTIGITATLLACNIHAGVINGGELLDQAGADFLEAQLGIGDLDFTNVSNLTAGDTSAQWHTDVSGLTNVISIYDMTYAGSNYLIGGYSAIGHDGGGFSNNGAATASNFLFNLSLGLIHTTQTDPYSNNNSYDQNDQPHYFATFGSGSDLHGGTYFLGNSDAYVAGRYDYNYGYSYGGSSYLIDGTTTTSHANVTINGLESFTFSSASPSAQVSEPSIFALIGMGILGLSFRRRSVFLRKKR